MCVCVWLRGGMKEGRCGLSCVCGGVGGLCVCVCVCVCV